MALHREWTQALSRALALPAQTDEAQRSKTAMLRTAIDVVVGGADRKDLPYQALAASLPPDLLV